MLDTHLAGAYEVTLDTDRERGPVRSLREQVSRTIERRLDLRIHRGAPLLRGAHRSSRLPARARLWQLLVLVAGVVERSHRVGRHLFADRSRRLSDVLGCDVDQHDRRFERVERVVLEPPPAGHFVVVDDDPRVQRYGRLDRRSMFLSRGVAADGPLRQVPFGSRGSGKAGYSEPHPRPARAAAPISVRTSPGNGKE